MQVFPSASQFERDETADGRRHGSSEDRKHRDYAGYGTVYAIILNAQGPEYHAGREEADDHEHKHTKIQKERIFRYPSAIFRYA